MEKRVWNVKDSKRNIKRKEENKKKREENKKQKEEIRRTKQLERESKKKRKKKKKPADDTSESDSEPESLGSLASSPGGSEEETDATTSEATLPSVVKDVGAYVAVRYDGEYFPGMILEVQKLGAWKPWLGHKRQVCCGNGPKKKMYSFTIGLT